VNVKTIYTVILIGFWAGCGTTPQGGLNKQGVNPWDTPTSFSLFIAQKHGNDFLKPSIAEALAEAGEFAQAMKVIQSMDNLTHRDAKARMLIRIVLAMSKSGKSNKLATLKLAEKVARTINNPQILADIALAQIKAGHKKQAISTLQRVIELTQDEEDAGVMATTLSGVASTLAKAGEFKQAAEVARNIQVHSGNRFLKTDALRDVSLALAKAGDGKQAVEVAGKIEVESIRSEVLANIALAQAKAGNKQQAEATLKLIKDARGKSIPVIASTLALVGEREKAITIFKQAVENTQNTENIKSYNYFRAFELKEIAEALAGVGEKERALQVFDQAIETALKAKDDNGKKWRLREIATAQAKTGKKKQDFSAFEQASKLHINNAETLSAIALAWAQVGEMEQAIATFKQAIEATSKAAESSAQKAIISDLVALNDKQQSTQILNLAIKVSAEMKTSYLKATSQFYIVLALLKPDNKESDSSKLDQAIELAQKMDTSGGLFGGNAIMEGLKAQTLSAIASTLHKVGKKKQAATTLKQAVGLGLNNNKYYKNNSGFLYILAFEPVPNKNYKNTNFFIESKNPYIFFDGTGAKKSPFNSRMKKAFTSEEKQIAKQLVEAIQPK